MAEWTTGSAKPAGEAGEQAPDSTAVGSGPALPGFDRLAGLLGILGAACILIGAASLNIGPQTADEQAWLELLVRQGVPAGAVAVLIGFVLLLPFTIALYGKAREGKADAANYALLGLVLSAAGIVLTLFQFTIDLDHDIGAARIFAAAATDTRSQLLVNELAETGLNLTVVVFQALIGLGWLASGLALLQQRQAGRTLAWFVTAVGAVASVSALLVPSGESDAGSVDLLLLVPVVVLGYQLVRGGLPQVRDATGYAVQTTSAHPVP